MVGNNKIMISMKRLLFLLFLLVAYDFAYAENSTVKVVISVDLDYQSLIDKIE